MARYAHIVGWGKGMPKKVMTNEDWAQLVDTTDEWIRSRTGIEERYIAGDGESTFTMSLEAARRALDIARVPPAHLDLIIVATLTPDHAIPATACQVQDALGAIHAAAFDLQAGCTGFIYATAMASDSIKAGSIDHALVIGAETMSRVVDWTDRGTCVLFGDGAGAAVISANESFGGVLSYALGADGSGGDYLIIPAGGSKMPATHQTVEQNLHAIKMNGREVFKFATRAMDKAVRLSSQKANLELDDISLVVPHQANNRILKSAAKSLGIPMDRVIINLDRYGNTSAATIPIALCEAIETDRVHRGDKLALVGFGAGLTWGGMILQWGVPLPVARTVWWRRMYLVIYYRWAKLRSLFARLQRRIEAWNPFSNNENGNNHPPPPAAPNMPASGKSPALPVPPDPEDKLSETEAPQRSRDPQETK